MFTRVGTVVAAAALLLTTACGSNGDDTDPPPEPGTGAGGESTPSGEDIEIREQFFTQDESGIVVTVVVLEDLTPHNIAGADVSVELLDASGEVIAADGRTVWHAESDLDSVTATFVSYLSRDMVIDAIEVAAVPTGSESVPGIEYVNGDPFEVTVSETGPTGKPLAVFDVPNSTGGDVRTGLISIACRDSGGAIVGGGIAFSSPMPAGGSYEANADIVLAADPDVCTAYPSFEV